MKDVARLLNDMKGDSIIGDYALFGATAQMRYTEPVATLDADVLILLPESSGLDPLRAIYAYCQSHGYKPQGEAILVGKWPVQFIPVFNTLTEEAVRNADTGDVEGVPLRVVTAAYLAVIALSVGRAKDHLRILSLLEAGAVSAEEIGTLARRHNVFDRWVHFQGRYLSA